MLRPRVDHKPRRQFGDAIAVAHPDDLPARQPFRQCAMIGEFDFRPSVFPLVRRLDATAQFVRHQLHAVANAENRHAELEHARVGFRRARIVDARRTTGKDDAFRRPLAKLVRRHMVRQKLAVDAEIAYAARDQLVVLSAEIEHRDHLDRFRHGTLRVPTKFRKNYIRIISERARGVKMTTQARKTALVFFLDQETAQAVQDEIWEFVTTFIRSPEFRPVPCPLTDPYLQKALEYLHHHYHEKVSIDTLCSIARRSKFHFIRSFRQRTGFSPHQYLLHLRVHHAKQLLKQKHKSIEEISEHLGFSCPSHFHRTFLKTVGMTPGVYRSQHT